MKQSFYYKQPASTRRPLKIFAFDPMLGRRQGGRITIDIPNEQNLEKGPKGERIEVIDYDGLNKVFYSPVDLNDQAILMQGGLEPTESDPRFHQQMVYAVAMKVLENFDTALGRKIYFRRGKKLRIFPHAFYGANAYYDSKLMGLFFGYFRADKQNPGPSLPGQTVFTCLSQDIIAHEMTHAIVDRLRPYFIEPSNRDVAAFHEGFSDIVAIFQHFSFPDILRSHIQETRGSLHSPNNLIRLASEFGYATGQGEALRSALDSPDGLSSPNPNLYQTVMEPHERGSILVAAVFDAFFKIYQNKIKDLLRIATGGTGKLPDGDLHPDLVNRVALEASQTAQNILNMCIRAFEYLPPVDITFGDYLRALVTADFELNPSDEMEQRATIIEAFRLRGIYPENVNSLAEDSLLWSSDTDNLPPLPIDDEHSYMLQSILKNTYELSSLSVEKESSMKILNKPWKKLNFYYDDDTEQLDGQGELATQVRGLLGTYAQNNAVALDLNPDTSKFPIFVRGFHPVFRINPRGQLLVEMVAQFTQLDPEFKKSYRQSGGLNLRGGTTVVAAANGDIRYIISKPLESNQISKLKNDEAKARKERQINFVRDCDEFDPYLAWSNEKYYQERITRGLSFKSIHNTIKR